MIERQPDFEDERIRVWKAGPEDRELEKSEVDPTMMCLDVEHEEIFESRTYRFQASTEALRCLTELVAPPQSDLRLSPETVLQVATGLMAETTFKFLAKRSKENGLIASLLIVVSGDERCLLSRHEWVEEDEYRQAVQEFETGFLPQGVLAAPMVTTLEEWRRYSQEGPLSEKPPDLQVS